MCYEEISLQFFAPTSLIAALSRSSSPLVQRPSFGPSVLPCGASLHGPPGRITFRVSEYLGMGAPSGKETGIGTIGPPDARKARQGINGWNDETMTKFVSVGGIVSRRVFVRTVMTQI